MKITCWNERQFDAVVEEMRRVLKERNAISISYDPPYKAKTKAQSGFIFGALIDSIVKYFRDCGIGCNAITIKNDLYSEMEDECPELMVENSVFGRRRPRMKTLSEMDRKETSIFIDGIFRMLEEREIFQGLELAPDIQHNWTRHITEDDIKYVRGLKFPERDERYLDYIRSLPCLVCGRRNVQAHHLKDQQLCGMAQKAPDWAAIPLCTDYDGGCHHALAHGQGPQALQDAVRWIGFDLKDFCRLLYNRWKNHI